MLVTMAAGGLAGLSMAITLWQWWVATRFPLHRRAATSEGQPPVTLLKPLKGCDPESEACLRSWFEQSYAGPVQILFGVASDEDPVCALVRRLIAEHPNCEAELIVCPKQLGPNGKVSTLAHLQPRIKHDAVVISDADVSVPRDLLTNLMAALARPKTGLVSCFYKLANPRTTAMRWEAIAVNADFWSQVLQSRTLRPLDFALGAVMGTRRSSLEKFGGFAALLDYLADDYHLGQRIAKLGDAIELCPVVVECRSAPMGWKQVWTHQLRWARTIRVCQPVPFFFSILSNSTLWPLLWVTLRPSLVSALGAACCVGVRVASAAFNYRKLTGERMGSCGGLLVLAKDLLAAIIWLLALGGRYVHWHGQNYRVLQDGRLLEPAVE